MKKLHFEKNKYSIYVEIEFKDGKFSCCGVIYDYKVRGRDKCVSAGQCQDTINEILKGDELWDKIYDQRERNHLNDMHAGTKLQEGRLKRNGINNRANDYYDVCKKLDEAGLLIDNGYKFGTGRLTWDISKKDKKIIEEIMATKQD